MKKISEQIIGSLITLQTAQVGQSRERLTHTPRFARAIMAARATFASSPTNQPSPCGTILMTTPRPATGRDTAFHLLGLYVLAGRNRSRDGRAGFDSAFAPLYAHGNIVIVGSQPIVDGRRPVGVDACGVAPLSSRVGALRHVDKSPLAEALRLGRPSGRPPRRLANPRPTLR